MRLILTLLLVLSTLTACGLKNDLYLPDADADRPAPAIASPTSNENDDEHGNDNPANP